MSITGIDHVLIAVGDLEAAALAYRRLGFETSPRGLHLGWGTANYCVMFPDDYVELIGIVNPREPLQGIDRFLETGEGLRGVALATDEMAATAAQLQRRGVTIAAPTDLARQLELPEGSVLPRFRLLHLPPAATPALSSFVCEQLTPELIRRAPWMLHPNGALRLLRMIVAVDDTRPLLDAYEKTFGYGQVNTTDDVVTVHLNRHRLVFAGSNDLEAMYPDLDLAAGPLGRAKVLTIEVRDANETAEYLAAAQVDFIETASGPLVEPEEACGVALEFVSAPSQN